MKTYICTVVVAILVSSACDGGRSVAAPTSPGPLPPPPIVFTISGTVTEMTSSGPVPLEGASVQLQLLGHRQETTTDGNGFYTLSGQSFSGAATHQVAASKIGFKTIYTHVAPITDTGRDFQLGRFVTYTLSGVVFEATEAGRRPIAGVELYCDGCGSPDGHTYTSTDADGRYRFEWTPDGPTPLWVDKEGYALAGNQPVGSMPGYIVPTVEGDTHFDIELVRR